MAHFAQFFLNILKKLTKFTGGQLFDIRLDLRAPGLRARICIQERQIDAAHDAENPHADTLHAHLLSQLAQLMRCQAIVLQLLLCQAQVVAVGLQKLQISPEHGMHDHVMPIVDELTEGLALDGGVGIHDAGQFNIDRMFFATNSAGVFQRDTAIPGRMHEVGKERESPVFSRPKPGVRIGFTFLYPFEKYRRSLFLTVRIDTGKIDGIGYGGFLQPDFFSGDEGRENSHSIIQSPCFPGYRKVSYQIPRQVRRLQKQASKTVRKWP